MPSTIIHLKDRQRSAGVTLLDLIDHEVRSMTTIICLFEQLRRLASDCDDAVELLLHHHERLCSIQRLALSLHETSIRNSPPL
jgi:hypothetical protein